MSSLRLKLEMISNWGVGGAFILLFHTVSHFSTVVSYDLISHINYLRVHGAVRVSTVSHGFVYEPYALHEKVPWWRRCLYVTSGSLRSLYSTHELAGVSVAVLNFLQRI
ncbi:hypothetical protein IGI04_023279 [Brassica rapa subsp. trilocularis]|uniref:Uncharacterized protein n=1 Tax=Brassica rapa subsp. trilocularis TaxID=1813537 RepID=A0ABQ7M3C6_BRACM|nr:hypothetical protein IGI04_023279 [Brassica rapa subsp. trilocularis]